MISQQQSQLPLEELAIVKPAKGRSGYVVLREAEQAELKQELRTESEDRLAREIGVSKFALVRAALGLEMQAGSVAMIRGWLHGRVRP